MQVLKNNPNTATAAGSGTLAVLVTWLASNVFHWSISAEGGAIIATAISTVALFVGRNGIQGIARMIWKGSRSETPEGGGAQPSPH